MARYVPSVSAKESPAALLAWANENDIVEIDLRFVDIRGVPQHVSMPIQSVDEGSFEDGFGFDGSSIQGFQAIHESDMILLADLSTAYIDPFFGYKTLAIYCDAHDPISRAPYALDARGVAKRAEAYLNGSGLADVAYFGPEAEFFMFDNVQYSTSQNSSSYRVDSFEGDWNSGSDDPAQGHMNRIKMGYFPLSPLDKTQDVRAEMVQALLDVGMEVEVHHHEVGGAGQAEIDLKYAPLLEMADAMVTYKYIIKNVALQNGLHATFMPKPLFGENGSGMHVHISLWKKGVPLFGGDKYAGLSQMALWFIGGLIKHAGATAAFTNPITNSYRRLVPGYEAPVNLVYSARNRSAGIRIPMYSNNPKAKRVEARWPDPAANPYLAMPALLMAGIDGIKNQIDPGESSEADLYEGEHETPVMPGTLGEALRMLEANHDFLLEGGVFSEAFIQNYIDYKQVEDSDAVAMRPHPYEFELYFSI